MALLGTVGVGKVAAGTAIIAVIGGGVGYALRSAPPDEASVEDTADEADLEPIDEAAEEPDAGGEPDAPDDEPPDEPPADEAADEPVTIDLDVVAMVSQMSQVSLVDDGSIQLVHLLEAGTSWTGQRCIILIVRESAEQITGFRNGTTPEACTPAEPGADTWNDLAEVTDPATEQQDPVARLLTHADLDRLFGNGLVQEVAFAEVVDGGGDPPTSPEAWQAQRIIDGAQVYQTQSGYYYRPGFRF